jgi:hypothetical protein
LTLAKTTTTIARAKQPKVKKERQNSSALYRPFRRFLYLFSYRAALGCLDKKKKKKKKKKQKLLHAKC